MNSIRDQFRSSMKQDGVDHINVSPVGETTLGRIASLDWRRRFYIPQIGDFASPRSFVNWIISGGDESLRESTVFYKNNAPAHVARKLLTFGKFYQTCSMRSTFAENESLFDLPWVTYKKFDTGIRQYDRWDQYGEIVKDMAKFIISNSSKTRYDWAKYNPEVLEVVNQYLAVIAGDDFVPFEQLDKVVATKPARQGKHSKEATVEAVKQPQEQLANEHQGEDTQEATEAVEPIQESLEATQEQVEQEPQLSAAPTQQD